MRERGVVRRVSIAVRRQEDHLERVVANLQSGARTQMRGARRRREAHAVGMGEQVHLVTVDGQREHTLCGRPAAAAREIGRVAAYPHSSGAHLPRPLRWRRCYTTPRRGRRRARLACSGP